ncbi:hypothetical protein RRG08_053445 [Elysia crispata]|uniref:Uncharacterized protein n=1 Tax=Elysia crispata TaxID=231223 RepID=A0AAE0ZFN3_9GAST|nr:hypothetical protein RRG08_053445 [Elysia crispata]
MERYRENEREKETADWVILIQDRVARGNTEVGHTPSLLPSEIVRIPERLRSLTTDLLGSLVGPHLHTLAAGVTQTFRMTTPYDSDHIPAGVLGEVS